MDIRKAVELLKKDLDEIASLRKIPCDDDSDNEQFKLLRYRVREIVEAASGKDSSEYRRIPVRPISTLRFRKTEAQRNEEYSKYLDDYEIILKSIIQKYEMLGIDAKPSLKDQPKDTDELPISLFNEMQFHQRVIAASKSLFKDGHYASAILEAYKSVNNFVKEKTNLSLDGKALMSKAFSEDVPTIKLNELLTQSDRDEQEGFKFLFMGAMVGIRNPKAHDNVIQTDPYRTLEYLSFASLLMKRIEEGKAI